MKTNKPDLPLVDKTIRRDTETIRTLEHLRTETGADIMVAGTLVQHWSNGTVRRTINFESKPDGTYAYTLTPPPEPSAYTPERWNPLNGLFVTRSEIETELLQAPTQSPSALLAYCERKGYNIKIARSLRASSQVRFSFTQPLRSILKSNQTVRDFAVFCHRVIRHLWRLLTEIAVWRNYHRELKNCLTRGEVVLDLEFGGLGDLLCFSSLPRLLHERHGVNFYLTESTREKVRNPEFIEVAFELNPYFKGYRNEKGFQPRFFLHDLPWHRWFSLTTKQNATLTAEKQFGVTDRGTPEIYYKPNHLPEYEKKILCDQNWFSGLKIGLYVDESLVLQVINQWQKRGDNYTVEFCTPANQTLRTYIDKIYSSGHFICYLSGGNSLAAALRKEATVVLPENIDGAPIENFLFTNSPITYLRHKSLRCYGI